MPVPNKVICRVITAAEKDAVIECLMEAFHSREPLAVLVGITKEETRLYSRLLCEKAIRDQLSIVAVDSETNELLGCIICQDMRSQAIRSEPIDKQQLWQNPKFKISYALLRELAQPLQTAQYPQGLNIFFHPVIVAVHAHFAHQGIFKRLLIASCQLAHERGFQYYVGKYTNPYTYQTMATFDQESGHDLNVIYYRDFVYEGERIFHKSTNKAILRITDLSKLISKLAQTQDKQVQTVNHNNDSSAFFNIQNTEWETILNKLSNNDPAATKLDLKLKQLGDDQLKKLAIALKDNASLLEIDLGWNQFGDDGALAFAAALKDNQTLRALELGGNQISDKGVIALAKVLKLNCRLTRLSLRYNQIGDVGAIALASVIRSNHTIATLNLRNNQISNKGVTALALALKANRTITALYLGWNKIGTNGAIKLLLAIKDNPQLKVLNLEHNQIDNVDVIATVLKTNRVLKVLNLANNQIDDKGAIDLAFALRNNRTLEVLELGWNQIGERGMKELALSLSANDGLKALYLGANKINAAGAIPLALALNINYVLTSLYLGGNQIGDNGVTVLSKVLAHNSTITALCLAGNNINGMGATKLATSLKTNRTLIELDLNHNNIGSKGAKEFAITIKENPTLIELYLGGNAIDDEGINELAVALKTNRRLTVLYLAANKITAAGLINLITALKANCTMAILDLGANHISDAMMGEINVILQRNCRLLDKMHKAVKTGDIPAVNQFLAQGVSLLAVSGDSYNTALHWAVLIKQNQMAIYLIKRMQQQKIPLDKRNGFNKTAAVLAKGTELEALFTSATPTLNTHFFTSVSSVKKSETTLVTEVEPSIPMSKL